MIGVRVLMRAAIIRMLYNLKQDVDYLKEVVASMGVSVPSVPTIAPPAGYIPSEQPQEVEDVMEDPEEQEYQTGTADLSLKSASMDLIEKVLRKHDGNRKAAAAELGISERTLYRKIKNIGKE